MDTKQCSTCKQTKILAEFYADHRKPDGRESRCRICKCAAVRRYREENPEVARASAKKSRKKQYATTGRARVLRSKYGITPEQYDTLLVEQGGVCLICGEGPSGRSNNGDLHEYLAVDHDHETGKVRGLLCVPCNRGLGFFRDDPQRLQSAIEHLARHTA